MSIELRVEPLPMRERSDELAAARSLAPAITARSGEVESRRRLPADLAATLADAGIFRAWVPRVYGGGELDPGEGLRVIEEVARADGSVGWCVMIGMATGVVAAMLPEAAARESYGSDPRLITGGAIAPTGKAHRSEGGYRLSGRWQWGSGIENCGWITANARLFDGEAPLVTENGAPVTRMMLVPAEQVEILDTWDTAGLRGTGSHDFQITDVYVPAERTLALGAGPLVVDTPLYRFPYMGLLAAGVSAVPLGIARRAIDEFTALAATKTPAWESKTLAQSPRVQSRVAEAEALVRSSRAFLFESVEAAWAVACAGGRIPLAVRRDLRLAAATVARQCAEAVDLMYNAGGGSSVHTSSPLGRCFRDVHAATQHIMVNPTVLEQAGRLYLGAGEASPLF